MSFLRFLHTIGFQKKNSILKYNLNFSTENEQEKVLV